MPEWTKVLYHIFFQRYKDFEMSTNYNQTTHKGRPKVYPDRSLIVFLAFMILIRY